MKQAILVLAALAALVPAGQSADEKPFPIKLVIPAKAGGVVYYHFAHAQRVKFDCSVCHASMWPQDAKASLKFKTTGHSTADGSHTSCGVCHRTGGTSFAVEGNCTSRCHSGYAGSIASASSGLPQ
jgi:c(7)-type cytochrome triheme protein